MKISREMNVLGSAIDTYFAADVKSNQLSKLLLTGEGNDPIVCVKCLLIPFRAGTSETGIA